MSTFENYEDYLERVIKAIRICTKDEEIEEAFLEEAFINGESLLREDLGIDSLDTLMLIGELEEEFNITINDNQFENIMTVDDIIDKLEKLTC